MFFIVEYEFREILLVVGEKDSVLYWLRGVYCRFYKDDFVRFF